MISTSGWLLYKLVSVLFYDFTVEYIHPKQARWSASTTADQCYLGSFWCQPEHRSSSGLYQLTQKQWQRDSSFTVQPYQCWSLKWAFQRKERVHVIIVGINQQNFADSADPDQASNRSCLILFSMCANVLKSDTSTKRVSVVNFRL